MGSGSHPVEVVGRIRGHPDGREGHSALSVMSNGRSVRVKTDQGYRDFVLDGVSVAEAESLKAFYTKYVEARVDDVRAGGRCTVMMYGPTGAGKSHTMFGSVREPGVAYLALHHIMNKALKGAPEGPAVNVTANVIEIYNEEVYDLLSSNAVSSPGPRSLKAMTGRARLEVRGRKVRNPTCICGGDPAKLAQEIAKVEKRRVVKSTNSNDRSSRSHCMVVLDVSGVGGRLVLVDMAGSENSDQAGCGSEAKIQTGKINQGNGALKRVVECIANGDPYIPYRDSKLTMLLQDSFEDDGAKILMVLCASPDTKDAHKTICTLEYGAKAKCIVRLPCSPPKDTATFGEGMEAVLQARLRFKDECIEKMRQEFELKEKEREAKIQELYQREEELMQLRKRVDSFEAERALKMVELQKQMDQMLEEKSRELKKTLEVEMQMRSQNMFPTEDRNRLFELEQVIENQRQEIALLRLRAEKAESNLVEMQEMPKLPVVKSKEDDWAESWKAVNMDVSTSFCFINDSNNDAEDEASSPCRITTENIGSKTPPANDGDYDDVEGTQASRSSVNRNLFTSDNCKCDDEAELSKPGWLPIIHETETDEALPKQVDVFEVQINPKQESHSDYPSQPLCPSNLDREFEKHCEAVVDEETNESTPTNSEPTPEITATVDDAESGGSVKAYQEAAERAANRYNDVTCEDSNLSASKSTRDMKELHISVVDSLNSWSQYSDTTKERDDNVTNTWSQYPLPMSPDITAARKARIENIFLLCGDRRELAAKKYTPGNTPVSSPRVGETRELRFSEEAAAMCATTSPFAAEPRRSESKTNVYVKWESTKTSVGKMICSITVHNNCSLADLRKEIDLRFPSPSEFSFLILGDMGGAPVDRETENGLFVTSLPCWDNNQNSRLACLRAPTTPTTRPVSAAVPFRSLENQILSPTPSFYNSKFKSSRLLHGENFQQYQLS